MNVLDDVVRFTDVRLLPSRYRHGRLYLATVVACIYFEDGRTEVFDRLQLVRNGGSWRLLQAARPQGMKDGGFISVQEWITPGVFASIRMRAIDQARRFEGRS